MADETKKVRTVSLVEAVAAFERLAAATGEVVDSQSPVPPGWVRLTRQGGCQPELLPIYGARVTVDDTGLGALVMYVASGWSVAVCEPYAEVAALIAAAQRAQARSTVVAAFTSTAHGDSIMVVTADGSCWAPCEGRMQPVIAGIDCGAIDDLEREAGR